jgi:hypothetical protein
VSDRDQTLDAIRTRGWSSVLLYPNTKMPAAPAGETWPLTSDPDVVASHLARGGNVGLLGGERNGLAIFDIDDRDAFAEIEAALGPLGEPWVETGSGKSHVYKRWEAGFPAKLRWRNVIIGEIQRGPGLQQVVMPPSIHPDTRRRYRWLVAPATAMLSRLSVRWRQHLLEPPRPVFRRTETGATDSVREAALAQPGARRRPGGKIKFACPACVAEGHDTAQDNAALFEATGLWGCAWAGRTSLGRAHWEAIGRCLGAVKVGAWA